MATLDTSSIPRPSSLRLPAPSRRTERLTGELLLRYACATLVSVVAAAGAQLVVRTDFCVGMSLLCLAGAPVSLYLRLHGMRVAGMKLSRPLWNAFTSFLWLVASLAWVLASVSDLVALVMGGGGAQEFLVRFSAGESLALLMQVFLLFAAFRSFALISDKDATLATVPSFCVLLLLIPVHHGIEVVMYFLIWTIAGAVLFALEHRADLRRTVEGRLTAAPGQDVKLAARGLITVLVLALVAAFGLSYFLTSRDPDERSQAETEIANLAGRMVQFALPNTENGGTEIERQIDFSNSPGVPSRTLLWRALVIGTDQKVAQPQYFRLFTLSKYSGATWTQARNDQKSIERATLKRANLPLPQRLSAKENQKRLDNNQRQLNLDADLFRPSPDGFAIDAQWPQNRRVFGRPTKPVYVILTATATNLGFIPLPPGVRTVVLDGSNQEQLRVRSDGAIDSGFLSIGNHVWALCDLPALSEYGVTGRDAPVKAVPPRPDAPQLTASERAQDLQLPQLSRRVRDFAAKALSSRRSDDSNLKRAQRLALALQEGSTYTLHPPATPKEVESTDFFLFEGGRRGYCTHFASALTVLCRSQGIPARVVSGFVPGEYTNKGFAMMRNANAHAWTEVWVDNWGWALVDATPAADRGDNSPDWLTLGGDWLASLAAQAQRWSRGRLAVLGASLALIVVGIYAFRRRERLRGWWAQRLRGEEPPELSRQEIIVAYERASADLVRRFRPRAAWETPDEWLDAATLFLAKTPATALPVEELRELTTLYLRARYAPQAPESGLVARARDLLVRLRPRKTLAPR